MNRVILSPEYFPNPTIGRPIANADIYVGIVDLDPEVVGNQKQISVQQENGTIVAIAQPISTGAGGVPLYLGSPVTILVSGDYSLKVLDSAGSQIYYVPKQEGFPAGTTVDDMLGLVNLTGQGDGDTAEVTSFFFSAPQTSFVGDGSFVWQDGVDKSLADGIWIIDPGATDGWDGTKANLAATYFGASGQGTGVGTGCWVRIGATEIRTTWAGLTGVGDETAELKAVAASAQTAGLELVIDSDVRVATFGEILSDAIACTVEITADIKIVDGGGVITAVGGAVSDAVFGVDGAGFDVELHGVQFAGLTRYRAYHSTPSASLAREIIIGVKTQAQNIISFAAAVDTEITGNETGLSITAATAISTQVFKVFPAVVDGNSATISGNTVRAGTEAGIDGFVIHAMPTGGFIENNKHLNLASAANEGYDIDQLGSGVLVNNNLALFSGFEYKVGSATYDTNRESLFTNNISWESWDVGFSLRSSAVFGNNLAYNPNGWGVFVADFTSDLATNTISALLNGFRVVYAGASGWNGGVKLGGVTTATENVDIVGLQVVRDPQWLEDNPGTKIPNELINISQDVRNIRIMGCTLDDCTDNQILIRPTARAERITIDNVTFGDTDDACVDAQDVDNMVINNPHFAVTHTDRVVRLTTCTAIRINCDYDNTITLAQTSGTNSGVLINNYGKEVAGIGNPPSAGVYWPIGCIVENTDDNTIWLRKDVSLTPATAWIQIA